MAKRKKVILAYSGGLDTSVAVKWLGDKYDMDVVAVCVDLGTVKDLPAIQAKALKVGAVKSMVIDASTSIGAAGIDDNRLCLEGMGPSS